MPKPGMTRGHGPITKFLAAQSGGATVEAVIWLPALFSVLCLVTDLAMIFNGQTLATRTLQDANRAYSVGRLTTTEQVEQFVEASLANLSPHAHAQAQVDGGAIFSQIVIPSSDLAATGWFGALTGTEVVIRSAHLIEY